MSEQNDRPVTASPTPPGGTRTESVPIEGTQTDTAEGGGAADSRETGFPQPPEEVVAAAKLAPEHWLRMVDPTWPSDEPPPEWAVIGRWRTDAAGEIVEWEDNEDYRPSPEALGWPEPDDPVDAAVQLAATGYGAEAAVVHALAVAEVAVFLGPDGGPATTTAPDDRPAIAVFTASDGLAAEDLPAHGSMPVTELLDRIPDGHDVFYLSSTTPVSMVVEAEALRQVLARTGAEAAAGRGAQER